MENLGLPATWQTKPLQLAASTGKSMKKTKKDLVDIAHLNVQKMFTLPEKVLKETEQPQGGVGRSLRQSFYL